MPTETPTETRDKGIAGRMVNDYATICQELWTLKATVQRIADNDLVHLTKDVKGIQTEIRWFSAMIVLVLLGAIATNYL